MIKRIKIKCKQCKKVFLTTLKSKEKYCNNECKKMFLSSPRICRNIDCQREFIPISPNQLVCTRVCAFDFNSFEYKVKNGTGGHPNTWLKLRFEVFKRDNFSCQYCGRNVIEDNIKIHCDHVIPKSKGGIDIISNLVTACQECNLGKCDVLLNK